jgi:hypothetical protein
MRSWSPPSGVTNGTEPGMNAWPPTRQRRRRDRSRHGWRERGNDLPPRPATPSASAPTPGMTAPLAPQDRVASLILITLRRQDGTDAAAWERKGAWQ